MSLFVYYLHFIFIQILKKAWRWLESNPGPLTNELSLPTIRTPQYAPSHCTVRFKSLKPALKHQMSSPGHVTPVLVEPKEVTQLWAKKIYRTTRAARGIIEVVPKATKLIVFVEQKSLPHRDKVVIR